MYMLCVGDPPFYHDDTFEMLELIRQGNFDRTAFQWMTLSCEARDLISSLLEVD